MKIHHIGYLVSDMSKAIKMFENNGGVLTDGIIFDDKRLIDIAFMQMGSYLIELVYPHEGSEAVGKALRRLKSTPYHLCFESGNIDKDIQEYVGNGCMIVEEPAIAVAINNQRVACLFSAEIGLFELVEIKRENNDKEDCEII